jgi:hypothetical protein
MYINENPAVAEATAGFFLISYIVISLHLNSVEKLFAQACILSECTAVLNSCR